MNSWFPEIMYEDGDGAASHFPFIIVPPEQEMPKILFIIESRDTGDREKDDEGNEHAVMDMEMHQYADMAILKRNLDPVTFDSVRQALGLEPLAVAEQKGQKITESVRKNLE